MVELYDTSILLVHGSLFPNKKGRVVADGRTTRWNYQAIQMKLVSVQTGGVAVVHVPHSWLRETVEKLREWSSKKDHRIVRDNKPDSVNGIWVRPSKASELMATLAGSLKRGKTLLDAYGTPAEALSNIDSWKDLHGIGAGTIRIAKNILGSDNVQDIIGRP